MKKLNKLLMQQIPGQTAERIPEPEMLKISQHHNSRKTQIHPKVQTLYPVTVPEVSVLMITLTILTLAKNKI